MLICAPGAGALTIDCAVRVTGDSQTSLEHRLVDALETYYL